MRRFVVYENLAAQDLDDLYAYIARNDSPDRAEHVFGRIVQIVESLGDKPDRGVIPQEAVALGRRDVREVFFKPYRILYRMFAQRVVIILVSDGRRDMRTLLQRRLLTVKNSD